MGLLTERLGWDKRTGRQNRPERFGQIPIARGIVFICKNCSRPTATGRDAVLKALGRAGHHRGCSPEAQVQVVQEAGHDGDDHA